MEWEDLPLGTIMTIKSMMIPTMMHIRIFMSFPILMSALALRTKSSNRDAIAMLSGNAVTVVVVQMVEEIKRTPHLLPDSIGTSTEPLRGNSKIISLILKRIEPFAALRDFVDVVAHHAYCVVDLL